MQGTSHFWVFPPFLGLDAFPTLKLHSRPGRLLRTNVAQPARFVVRAKIFCCSAWPFLWSACLCFSALKLHSRPGLLSHRPLQACSCTVGQQVCWRGPQACSCIVGSRLGGCSSGCIVGQCQCTLIRVLQGPCFFQFWASPFLVFAQLLLSSTLLAVQGHSSSIAGGLQISHTQAMGVHFLVLPVTSLLLVGG